MPTTRAHSAHSATENDNAAPRIVPCPFCGSDNTAQEAAFGTTHAYAQFYCHACRTPFEWIKWEDLEPANDLPHFLQS